MSTAQSEKSRPTPADAGQSNQALDRRDGLSPGDAIPHGAPPVEPQVMLPKEPRSARAAGDCRKPTHPSRTGGKELGHRAEALGGGQFRPLDVRPRPKCLRGSRCLLGAPTSDRQQTLLGPTQFSQSTGTLPSDQRLQPEPDKGGLLFDASELGCLAEEPIIDIQRCSHMHEYAL